jgi:HEAT repeat protein
VNAFVKEQNATFDETGPQFQRVKAMGATAVPYLVDIIRKNDSFRDTPPNPPSHHPEGRDLMRIRAYWALGGLHSYSRSAVPFLIQEFTATNDMIDFASYALENLGEDARPAIPVLTKKLKDSDFRLRWAAAGALAKMDPANPELMPMLLSEINSPDVVTRRFACITLGEMGPDAEPATPILNEAAKDKDEWVRYQATNALVKIRRPSANNSVSN